MFLLIRIFQTFRKDAWWLKTFVAVVWTLDTVHQALTLKFGYNYLVTEFGDADIIGLVNP